MWDIDISQPLLSSLCPILPTLGERWGRVSLAASKASREKGMEGNFIAVLACFTTYCTLYKEAQSVEKCGLQGGMEAWPCRVWGASTCWQTSHTASYVNQKSTSWVGFSHFHCHFSHLCAIIERSVKSRVEFSHNHNWHHILQWGTQQCHNVIFDGRRMICNHIWWK